MPNIYKNLIKVGESTKTLITVNHTQEEQIVETKTVDAVHHVHVLDRSGSMSGLIGQLIEEVKMTLDHISDEDYVSIVWFSGANECKTLFKGSKRDKALYNKLDTLKSTVGLTCFSTPMQEVNEIIEDLYDTCPNISITLFTDGQPVVPWSEDEEERKIFTEIQKMKDKVLALNTIGYGYYYNQDLLRRMSQETTFGTAIHSNKINEYLSIFDHNYEKVADLVAETVEITAPVGSDIVYLNSSSTKLEKNTGYLKLNRLEKRKNQFFIVGEDDFDFIYNGEIYNTKNIKEETQLATILNFYYAYAYELHYFGYRNEALEIMAKNIKDKYFIDKQLNTFTYDEVAALRKELKKAVIKPKDNRYRDGEAPDGYLPKEDALCVMDILSILSEGTNYYIPSKNYSRIGQAVVDNQNMFKANDEEVKSLFSDFVFNKEKLNVSIPFVIKGKTTVNAKTAARVGLDKEIDSKIHRTHTVIKDGNLNMETIDAILDQKTYDKIIQLEKENNVTIVIGASSEENSSIRVTLDLTQITVINKTYVNDSANIDTVLDSTIKMNELEAKQKVVNSLIKEIKANNIEALKEGAFATLTEEQIEVLKEHGLSKDLVYGGVDNEVQNPTDFYIARKFSFQLKGMASLPSLSKVLEDAQDSKKALKIKGNAKIMLDYYNDLSTRMLAEGLSIKDLSVEAKKFLEKELSTIKSELFTERFKMNLMKIALVLTGNWFIGTEVDDKGNETYTRGDIILVIKREKIEVPV